MANVYLSDRVKEMVTQYFYLLPLQYGELKENTYAFISTSEVKDFQPCDHCSVIVVLDGNGRIALKQGINYVRNDPKEIANLIQILYCSEYYELRQRTIIVNSNDLELRPVSYLEVDEIKSHIDYINHHPMTLHLTIIITCLLVCLVLLSVVNMDLRYVFGLFMFFYLSVLLSVYAFYYLVDLLDKKILRKRYLKKVTNKEFDFYCLSQHIESIEL